VGRGIFGLMGMGKGGCGGGRNIIVRCVNTLVNIRITFEVNLKDEKKFFF
jgi:hypothetical protein